MNKNQDLPTATQIKAPGLVRRAVAMGALSIAGLAVLAGCSLAVPDAQPTATPAPTGTESVSTGSAATESGLGAGEQEDLDQRLIRAAKDNDVELVRELIAAGGNVNAKDSLEDSAFLYSGAEGFNEILELTIENGADVKSLNRYGGTALIPASEHGHIQTVKILIDAGVPLDHVNNPGWTALQEAVLLNDGGPNQQEVARLLLEAGADPQITDQQGRTALENARRLGFKELADVIESHG
ncbi:ankyrin repeat domain-containing protein [Glutamicibacter halophytocola]|uniref:Ankyrin repeat domain-containing protein n=1 Tax=Glutamicibacter halophytocola TaxID=1933880 RepID=A0AA94XWM8_9MICC|nr:ankyrin repeat domain-containing protein [Glutamicibacter halophytocola]UUX58718.1 ankyrin repeat domain-containing protein [Glutamicibacter halophytocola]